MVKSFLNQGHLTEEERNLIKQAIQILNSRTFDWDTTEQGAEYWGKVCEDLDVIAHEKPVCESCGQKLPDAQ